MENSLLNMDYREEFKGFLDTAEKCGQSYVGHGNPNADILIVANEPGTVDKDIIEKDLNTNLSLWRGNLNTRQSIYSLPEMFDENHFLDWLKFNPLWPFKGQHFIQIKTRKVSKDKVEIVNLKSRPTSRSWLQYQKLIDMIFDKEHKCHRAKTDSIDFFKLAYITDFSDVYGLKSSDISRTAREESITNRLPLFSSDFISHFPVIIVASGHYVRDFKQLKDLRTVFPGFSRVERIDDDLGWRNIHKSEDGKRILIHTKHFASAINDSYLSKIAMLCSDVLKMF